MKGWNILDAHGTRLTAYWGTWNVTLTIMGKCTFSEKWLETTEFQQWLRPVNGNNWEAYCSVCKKRINRTWSNAIWPNAQCWAQIRQSSLIGHRLVWTADGSERITFVRSLAWHIIGKIKSLIQFVLQSYRSTGDFCGNVSTPAALIRQDHLWSYDEPVQTAKILESNVIERRHMPWILYVNVLLLLY